MMRRESILKESIVVDSRLGDTVMSMESPQSSPNESFVDDRKEDVVQDSKSIDVAIMAQNELEDEEEIQKVNEIFQNHDKVELQSESEQQEEEK